MCVIEASFKRHNNLFARIRDTHSPFLLAFSSVPPRPWGIEGGKGGGRILAAAVHFREDLRGMVAVEEGWDLLAS